MNGTDDTSASVTTYKGRTAIEIGTVKIKGTNQLSIAGMNAADKGDTDFSWGPFVWEGLSTQTAPPSPAPRRSTASPFPGTSRSESVPDRRAEGAWSTLESLYGMDAGQITRAGFGSSKPIDTNIKPKSKA